MVAALSMQGLSKSFSRAGTRFAAVDDVSFDIAPGETLALAGPSGSGKSTLARLVMRLIEPDAGSIHLDGQAISSLSGEALRTLRPRFQMVFQDSTAAFNPRTTVAKALDDPLRIHSIAPRRERPARIAELLEQVGLSATLASRAIHEISGGQRQRVAIARAIATNPTLLVLDEAVSAIDASRRGEILQLLLDLQRRRSMSYLFVSHDVALVRAFAHRVAFMETGRVVEIGAADVVIDNPQSAIARAMISAVPRLRGASD